jgi:iron(III) transport system ATP-binding protein
MSSITIAGIAKSFGPVDVLKSVDLSIGDGEFFTLLGPSGCGKTTLLRILAGLHSADMGSVHFDREDVTDLPAHRRDVGMVFQDYALFPNRSVAGNVAYGLEARKLPRAAIDGRVAEYLDYVGLTGLAARHPAHLSGGQRQRAALARAMAIRPRVLLMDEPLSNLDAKLRVQLREAIRDLQVKLRTTTVFVTHDQEEALSMSDRIAVLDRGSIVQVGTPADLYDNPANSYVASFVGAANIIPVELLQTPLRCGQVTVRFGSIELKCQITPGEDMSSVVLVARPEQLRIASAIEGTENSIPGRVLRRSYLGGKTLLRIATEAKAELTVEQWSHTLADIPGDGRLSVIFPSSLRVVPA